MDTKTVTLVGLALAGLVCLGACGNACVSNGEGAPWNLNNPNESESIQALDCTHSLPEDHQFLGGDVSAAGIALEIGPDSCPRVLLRQEDDILYGIWDGGQWQLESIETFSGLNRSDLAIDSNGRPHVVYSDFESENTTYAQRAENGRWEKREVAQFAASELNIRITPGEEPVFFAIYRDDTSALADPSLHYFERVDDRWNGVQLMEESQINYLQGAVEFDPAGRPAFAMASGAFLDKLTLGRLQPNGEWRLDSLQLDRHEAERANLVFDGSGKPVLVFASSRRNQPLGVATQEQSEWRVTTTDVAVTVGFLLEGSFLDEDGRLHVIHSDRHSIRDGGSWQDGRLPRLPEGSKNLILDYAPEQHVLHTLDGDIFEDEPHNRVTYRALDLGNSPVENDTSE
jgi:hypothetical protein